MRTRSIRVADLGTIYDGPHATPTRRERGPYFLNISSLSAGRLDLGQSDHVSREDFSKWTRRVTPRAGDLLFSYETRLGEAALMPDGVDACLGRRMALLRPDRERIDSRFLLYFYLSPAFRGLIDQHTIRGATVNRIGLSSMGNWEVNIPELGGQRAIAEVLGALDDKIAANTKEAELAMHLARLMFESAVGDVPRCPMSQVLVPILGGTPSRSDETLWGGSHLWASAKDIAAAPFGIIVNTQETISELAAETTRAKPLQQGSVILTARGTVGAVARLGKAASFNQSCYGFEPGPLSASVLYFTVLQATERAKAIAHGSVFDTITMRTFDHLLIPRLTEVDMQIVEDRLHPLLDLTQQTVLENGRLSELRDVLLPQLMSGTIRVKDAEARLGEVL